MKEKKSFQIKSEQDFILFGREFSNSFLKPSADREIIWFAQDGDCILKEQIPLRVFTSEESTDFSFLLKSVSYLSGAATLVRCYVENAGDMTIVGSISKQTPFPDWEKQAVYMGGGVTDFSCVSCSSEKNFSSLVKKNPSAIALDVSGFSESNCITYLKEIPKEIKRGICGPILPEDVIKFLSYPLDFIMPSFLLGDFPSVKMIVSED
ncbi:MAG: hypothetical protein OXB86_00225 [Bdellovibrionales bacterium]|nr:hypothetical protein [Bdellovibrionales bacterium]